MGRKNNLIVQMLLSNILFSTKRRRVFQTRLGYVLINFFWQWKPSMSASKLKKLLKISFEADLPHWVTHGVVPLNANRHRQKHRPHPTHVSQSHAEEKNECFLPAAEQVYKSLFFFSFFIIIISHLQISC